MNTVCPRCGGDYKISIHALERYSYVREAGSVAVYLEPVDAVVACTSCDWQHSGQIPDLILNLTTGVIVRGDVS